MDFRILGPLEVLDEDRVVTPAGAKQRALLALLVLHANETLSNDRLVDKLWGGRPPATAAKTVQVHVSRLRKALEGSPDEGAAGVVVTRERGYELRADPERVDAYRFERLVVEGRSELIAGRPERAASVLGAALSLWRGPPLAEFAGEHFAQAEIARLEDVRVAALEELIEAKLTLGRHAEVVGALEPLIAEHPYRERLRAQLMLALYRCERQADALQAYQNARRKLVEELGIEPGERLRELERAILDQDPALGFRPDTKTEARLPAPDMPRSAFAGRESSWSAVSMMPSADVGACSCSGASQCRWPTASPASSVAGRGSASTTPTTTSCSPIRRPAIRSIERRSPSVSRPPAPQRECGR